MADYTYTEIMRMQNDAIKRVEEMQKRARKTVELENQREKETQNTPEIARDEPRRVSMPKDYLENLKQFAANSSHKEKESEPPTEKEVVKRKPPKKETAKENPFGDLSIDEDKALILALILLLSEEGADELLIMALIYMLT
jgi:hypothetical protein